ncbi:hypothetical protein N9C84_00280 [Desulfobacterales bacterium]|nr:hypothetical protein [Desulfobacterales bacterium]
MIVELRQSVSLVLLARMESTDPPTPGQWFLHDHVSYLVMQRRHRYKLHSGQIAETITEQISEPNEAPIDPDDWSEELTAIDLQLKRIGWTREHEHMYLERAYGHGSRHKLTRYSDLLSYLNMLKSFEVGAEASAVQTPLRRGDLITQGDEILTTLKWDQERAKSFLQSKSGATSRQQLSDEQLFEFNMFLEEQLIAKMPKGN